MKQTRVSAKNHNHDYLGSVWNSLILLKLKIFAESTVDKDKS